MEQHEYNSLNRSVEVVEKPKKYYQHLSSFVKISSKRMSFI